MPQLKKGPKIAMYAIVGLGLLYGAKYAMDSGLVPKPPVQESSVPQKIALPDLPKQAIPQSRSTDVKPVSLPKSNAEPGDSALRCELIAWNAQAGLILANGGAKTARGSLVANNGSNLTLIKQNDVEQMKKNIVAFATAMESGNPNPTQGVPCVIVMWDGAPGFVTGVNAALSKLGADYQLKNVASFGYSRGEDKFMGPPAWKENPQLMKGKTIAGYIGDGDWNIAMVYIANNNLCNNPDVTSYDPNCVNWLNTNDHIDAAQKYITGYCENRKVVGSFKEQQVCVDGVVTWTPGDVMVAKEKGGLISLLSTFENYWQMPSAMLVIDKYAQDNRKNIEGILDAGFDAGDLIKNDTTKLKEASALVAQVYQENDAAYWEKYFTIQQEKDKTGLLVTLGGSSVNNLADNLFIMGLAPDSETLLVNVYNTFGRLFVGQYPDRMDSFVAGEDVVDTSYVKNVALMQKKANKPVQEADKPAITQTTRIKTKVADRAYSIEFATGKADFTPQAEKTLNEILDSVTIAGNLAIQIIGHTDDTGTAQINRRLSEKRAFAVRDWLKAHGKGLPNIENAKASGMGSDDPVDSNDTEAGRSKNRRVQVVLGTAQ